jgi:hypothetical protein
MQDAIDEPVNKPIDNAIIIAENVNNCIRPEFPKPFEETKWLVMTSVTFLIPAVYAFVSSLYLYGCISLFTSALSCNHWRDAEDGVRRAVDCHAARIGFAIYAISAFMYSSGIFLYGLVIPVIIITVTLFFISNHLSIQGHPRWHVVHAAFHLFVTIGSCIVIYSVIKTYDERKQLEDCIAPTRNI